MASFIRKLSTQTPVEAFSELSVGEEKRSNGNEFCCDVVKYAAKPQKQAFDALGASSPEPLHQVQNAEDGPGPARTMSPDVESDDSATNEDVSSTNLVVAAGSLDGRTKLSKEARHSLNYQARKSRLSMLDGTDQDLDMPGPKSARHITEYFDRHGMLRQECPRHWVLAACQSHPLHQSYLAANDRPVGLSKRTQNANAKTTLEVNKMQRENQIRACIERQCIEFHGQLDSQQQRYMRLLFDPVIDFQAFMPEDVLDEGGFDVSSFSRTGDARNRRVQRKKQGTRWDFMKKGVHTIGLRLALSAPDRPRNSNYAEHKPGVEATTAGILSNEQRSMLLSIFQRYVLRVSGGMNSSDQMQRSTWFRFLHHSGILGPNPQEQAMDTGLQLPAPDFTAVTHTSGAASNFKPPLPSKKRTTVLVAGAKSAKSESPIKASDGVLDTERKGGVSWSHGSSVFAIYAESQLGPPTMTFSNWVNAVQHVLRGPSFYRTQKEVLANLFGVMLQRCEARISGEQGKRPGSPARDGSLLVPDFGAGTHSSHRSSQATPPSFSHGVKRSIKTAARKQTQKEWSREQALRLSNNFGVLGWQSDLAEEQMCEPEVIQLLHEFETPLQKLFMIYAMCDFSKGTAKSRGLSPVPLPTGQQRGFSPPSVPAGFSPDTVAGDSKECTNDFDSSASEDSNSLGEADEAERLDALQDLDSFKRRRSSIFSTAMEPDNFHGMLHELGFLPTIVQTHSAQQHVDISLARRHAHLLTYESFIECLCRIAFVFLSIFGNSVQQAAPSKAKVVWLITLLRSRCRDLNMPDGLGDPRGSLWSKKKHFNLDACNLETVVVWPAMNSSVGHSRVKQQIAERGVPRLSVTCLHIS